MAWVERRLGLTPSGAVLAALTVAGWLAARAAGARVMFYVVYAMAALLVGAWLSGRRRLAVDVERSEIPMRVREGQTVAAEVSLTARRRLGTLVVIEELPPALGTPARLSIPTLPSGRTIGCAYTFTPRRRGVWPVGPLVAVWRDPFGLVSRRIPLLDAAELIVHPHVEPVHDRVLSRQWEDPPIRPPVTKPWPSGFEFYGMREYSPGDDPRRIVWRAVARTGRYLVREAEQGITDRVTLVIDTDERVHSAGEESDTFEAAVRAVASLGTKHLHDGFAVTLDTSAGRVAEALRGERQRIRFLDHVARLVRGRETLTDALRRSVTDPRRDTHYVIVSPLLVPDAAGMVRILLARGGSVTFVHVASDDAETGSGAEALGCEVVELRPGSSVERAFRHGVGAGVRR